MTFFRDGKVPSCSLCRFATEYIPYYTYPFFDPYCSKGHGQCKVDKFCEDFRLINGFYCDDCECMITVDGKDYCQKNDVFVDKFQTACAYIVKKEDVYG